MILRRLESYGVSFQAPYRTEKTWQFASLLKERTNDFQFLVKNHLLLTAEYSIHCTQLAYDLLHKDQSELTQQLEEALILAELLEHIYCYYLNVPREGVKYRGEQSVYRGMLVRQGYLFKSKDLAEDPISSPSKSIRELTATINLPRNFITRLRRLMVSISPLTHELGSYRQYVGAIDEVSRPLFAYASWSFFAPRAVTNLILTGKHLIPGPWMSHEEDSLDLKTRFRAQMERRWFELGNDIAWMVLGVLNCFVLTGALAPIGFYGSALLLAYDVVLASLRVYIEVGRLYALEEQYQKMLDDPKLSDKEKDQARGYLDHLQKLINYEKNRLYIQVINTVVLLLAFTLAFPVFAFNPIIPLVGAIVAVLMTIACYQAGKWVDKQKPLDKVVDPGPQFFKPRKDSANGPSPIEIDDAPALTPVL